MGDRNFERFCAEVKTLLTGAAAAKGYNSAGVDGPNEVYAFVRRATAGDAHALGEIIYKVLRYERRQDVQDVVKIAAWAYLVYHHHEERGDA